MARRAALLAIVTGVIAQLVGLGVDGVLHARDATLADREGVLSLTNPGHLLFAGGLALTVIGSCVLLLGPLWARRRRTVAGTLVAVLPVAGVLLLSGAAFALAAQSGGLTGAHAHAAPATVSGDAAAADTSGVLDHSHDHGATAAASPAAADDLSRHQHGNEVNVSWQQLRDAQQILDTAKAATEKYRDVSAARADGYLQVTQVVPGLGAHFINPALMGSGTFDPAHPPILLYDYAPGGGFELVGVSWALPKRPGDETPPASPLGALAAWHYHTDLCFGLKGSAPTVSTGTAAGCRAAGGVFLAQTPWMVHAWIFRDSPEGVFSHENSTITGRPPANG